MLAFLDLSKWVGGLALAWKRVALVVAIFCLCAPSAYAELIVKDANAKLELKKTSPKIPAKTNKLVNGFAKFDKSNGQVKDKVKVTKTLKFDLKDTKLGDLKLKSLTAKANFKLPLLAAGKKKNLEKDKKLILDFFDKSGLPKQTFFNVPMTLLALNIDPSALISGFNLSQMVNAPPVTSQDGMLTLLGITASTARVSEPSTLLLFAAGLFGLACMGKRRGYRATGCLPVRADL